MLSIDQCFKVQEFENDFLSETDNLRLALAEKDWDKAESLAYSIWRNLKRLNNK